MARLRRPRVLLVLGTRPEAIKLAPVARALLRRGVAFSIVSTGQHRELVRAALRSLGLRLDRDLGLMRRSQTPAELVERAVPRLEVAIRRMRPSLVVVQGDTTSALCGALAAVRAGVPLAHVEAGLRTGDLREPFPEEGNRVAIDAVAALPPAPTTAAARNLRGAAGRVVVTGSTAVDALRWMLPRARRVREPKLRRALAAARSGEALLLATLHRRESLGARLRNACLGLRRLLDREPGIRLLFPVHLNPRVQAQVRATLRHERAHLLPPLGHADMLAALQACRFVLTDSGGLQEEAPTLGKPVLVLRRKTDRPEAVAAGRSRVVGLSSAAIVREARRLLHDEKLYRRMARRAAVFGDGRAGERIAGEIARFVRAEETSTRSEALRSATGATPCAPARSRRRRRRRRRSRTR